jgi:hypothetical protein
MSAEIRKAGTFTVTLVLPPGMSATMILAACQLLCASLPHMLGFAVGIAGMGLFWGDADAAGPAGPRFTLGVHLEHEQPPATDFTAFVADALRAAWPIPGPITVADVSDAQEHR